MYVIGLMSGTSMDGVDLVYVQFNAQNKYQIHQAITVPYPQFWLAVLKNIAKIPKGDKELIVLDVELGKYFAKIIHHFIKSYSIHSVDLIASHGHTVHHQPDNGYTLQIGSGQEIFKQTNIATVCNFRTQDVLLGGQGAPLVPVGDALLFSEYDYCLNLGGFSNVSYSENGVRKAFDICPVNTILNFYANQLGLDYDDKGNLARKGTLNFELLAQLNAIEFYNSNKPKSLGVEFVNSEILPLIKSYDSVSVYDVLRTFVEHIAIQITNKLTKGTVLVTGGGAYHLFLLERIQLIKPALQVVVPSKELIDYKEALVFALLGKLRLENKVNCLASVTGATKNHTSGDVFV